VLKAAGARAAHLHWRKFEPAVMPIRRINSKGILTPSPIVKPSDSFGPGEGKELGFKVAVGDREEPPRLSAGTPA